VAHGLNPDLRSIDQLANDGRGRAVGAEAGPFDVGEKRREDRAIWAGDCAVLEGITKLGGGASGCGDGEVVAEERGEGVVKLGGGSSGVLRGRVACEQN
jgi:hypothetical protein